MTKERELLRRVVKDWDSDSLSDFVITMDEIEAHLAAEEGKQEELNLSCKSVQKRLAYQWGFVLPEQRKPLSEDEIMAALSVDAVDGFQHGFWSGVRFAEKHHGIGGGDE